MTLMSLSRYLWQRSVGDDAICTWLRFSGEDCDVRHQVRIRLTLRDDLPLMIRIPYLFWGRVGGYLPQGGSVGLSLNVNRVVVEWRGQPLLKEQPPVGVTSSCRLLWTSLSLFLWRLSVSGQGRATKKNNNNDVLTLRDSTCASSSEVFIFPILQS